MSNVTIAVDEQTLKRARIRALDEGTTLDTVLREYLENYAGPHQERREAWERIQALVRQSGMSTAEARVCRSAWNCTTGT